MNRIFLTAAEAEALLPPDPIIHRMGGGGGLFIGCDLDRAEVVKAFGRATAIELAGEVCMAIKHPIIAWVNDQTFYAYEADMAKVAEIEKLYPEGRVL